VTSPAAEPRERILRAAADLFDRMGVAAVGVEAVIEHADVTRQELLALFPSKAGLVAEVMRRSHGEWRRRLAEDVAARDLTAAGRLLAVFDALAALCALPDVRTSPFFALRLELTADEQPTADAAADHAARLRAWLTDLARVAGAGDPSLLAAQLHQLMRGVIVMARERDEDAAALARATAAALLAAHGVRDGRGAP